MSSENKFQSIVKPTKRELTIIGTNALAPHLEREARYLQLHLGVATELQLRIFHESDNDNFSQAVLMSVAHATTRSGAPAPPTFTDLTVHLDRIRGRGEHDGLAQEIWELAPTEDSRARVRSQVQVRQLHLRTPMDLIKADDRIWYSPISHHRRSVADYIEAERDSALYSLLDDYVQLVKSEDPEVGVFLSDPGDELIWVYDRSGVARGIFPRRAFYTTDYARYSVWGLVFDRHGKLLLQRRSLTTKDNRGMWDKSVGGHVDLEDASTGLTAKRELIEEMYLPKAEFTKHVRADVGDIIDFGEWNPRKRPERSFREAFRVLSPDDWVMFRAVDGRSGLPLTVNRISERLWHDTEDEEPRVRRTVFMSDVYFFMAPSLGDADTSEQILSTLAASDEAAASAYRFVSVPDLVAEISEAERNRTHTSTYTDDLLYLVLEHRDLLDSIASFARFVSAVD